MKKVLLLSCNTGQGHNTAGKAVKEELERRGITCDMQDALSFGPKGISGFICGFYIRMVVHTPHVFGMAYGVAGKISSPKRRSAIYACSVLFAQRLTAYIEKGGYDAVVCSHLFPAEMITMARRHGRLSLVSAFVDTDYTCHPFTEETKLDLYCGPAQSLMHEFVERGIPENKLLASGIPVSARFSEPEEREAAREMLKIDEQAKVVLVMTGSMGCGNIRAMLNEVLPELPDNGCVMVMGGNNEALKKKLRKQYAHEPRVQVIDFTREVPAYMAAADVLVTKPGGLSTTEALVLGVPLVLFPGIPGCETYNRAFCDRFGLALNAGNEAEAGVLAVKLLKEPALCRQMVERQHEIIPRNAAAAICDRLNAMCEVQ